MGPAVRVEQVSAEPTGRSCAQTAAAEAVRGRPSRWCTARAGQVWRHVRRRAGCAVALRTRRRCEVGIADRVVAVLELGWLPHRDSRHLGGISTSPWRSSTPWLLEFRCVSTRTAPTAWRPLTVLGSLGASVALSVSLASCSSSDTLTGGADDSGAPASGANSARPTDAVDDVARAYTQAIDAQDCSAVTPLMAADNDLGVCKDFNSGVNYAVDSVKSRIQGTEALANVALTATGDDGSVNLGTCSVYLTQESGAWKVVGEECHSDGRPDPDGEGNGPTIDLEYFDS